MTDHQPASNRLVVAAFAMTLSSAFGQTYFIALFAPSLKEELGLTDGGFGSLYTFATIASAAVLLWAGKFADMTRIRGPAAASLLCLAAACIAMASLSTAWLLLPVLFGLRLFGQGAQGQLAITGVGRWYRRRRGRMMAVAVLGFPVSEAVMPLAAVTLISGIGWRSTWLVAAGMLAFVSVPLVLLLLRREPAHDAPPEASGGAETPRREWTRAEVLRQPAFFAVLCGIVTPAFVMTGIFFHQAYLVESKGWSLAWFAGWFAGFALVSVLTSLLAGWLVDRFAARRLLPFFLLPLALAVTVLAFSTSPYAVPAFMMLSALTQGSSATLLGALWAELFGTRHLGAIRSVAYSTQVLATALAPGLIGVLLDLGVGLEVQYLAMAAYALAASLWLRLLLPSLNRLARS